MKINHPARLTALLLAALLLLPLFTTADAQRRRRRASTPARPRPATTNAPPRSNSPSARAADAAPSAAAARRREGEAPVEALLAADAYGVFIEVRKLGRLAQDAELKTALAALRLSGELPREYNDLVSFVTENAEALGEARYVLTLMPAGPGLPTSLAALQFPTIENAVAFEPKYRKFVNAQLKMYNEAKSAPPAPAMRGARGGRRSREAPTTPELNILFKRIGNCLVIGSEPFTLKRLRGDGTSLLADSVRFQSMRSRFASESLFV
ncbi:MAG: hypothetical protein LC802_23885, partial [Acidobacteria bacterium]|nr:hypothetical protein [Acidobacteriota bacterium]